MVSALTAVLAVIFETRGWERVALLAITVLLEAAVVFVATVLLATAVLLVATDLLVTIVLLATTVLLVSARDYTVWFLVTAAV